MSCGKSLPANTLRGFNLRQVIVLEHISLDGVIQAPGGPDEDTSGGFAYGGWIASFSDSVLGTALRKQMSLPFDLLLGRKTFEIWAPYWPHHGDAWSGVNMATKYVASNTMTSAEWQPSVFLNGDTGKSRRNQATARAGFARLGKR
jgi:dihydrofolate reductase